MIESNDMTFLTLSDEEKKQLTDIEEDGFEFDWTIYSSDRSETVSCIVNGDIGGLVEFERQPENLFNYLWLIEVANQYKGTGVAGKLLAYVARDSLNQGFEGFVLFEAKSVLVNYYIEKYGAKLLRVGQRKLYFDQKASEQLIKLYLDKED